MTTYGQVGVDVDIEAEAAKRLYTAAKETWPVRVGRIGEVSTYFDDFSGTRGVHIGGLPDGTVMMMNFDGIGTKVRLAMLLGRYNTAAYDLIAMVCDDTVIRGAEPIMFGSSLDVNTLGQDMGRMPYIDGLCEGYSEAGRYANVSIVNGEIAQLNTYISIDGDGFKCIWNGATTWLAHESRLISGRDVRIGDFLLGLREKTMRSNGNSLVFRILTENRDVITADILEAALAPSQIYTPTIIDMTGGYDLNRLAKVKIHAMAHITGSGPAGKIARALKPSGLGAVLDDPFQPADLMLLCQQLGDVTDYEAYRTWNMGQGMVIITPDPGSAIAVAESHGIEARVIGRVTAEPGIKIHSQGYNRRETPILEYK